MNYLFVLVLVSMFLGNAQADEISLLENNEKPVQAEDKTVQLPQAAPLLEDESSDDDFDEMDDFITIENDKLKDIKLLNLDLEKAGLELKKKEIEQKMLQLNRVDGLEASGPSQANETETRFNIKLLAVFLSASQKQAILSINGTRVSFIEGQETEGMMVKAIKPRSITFQYSDGRVQELYLL